MRTTFNHRTTRYRKTTVNGQTVQMHRLIMERKLGRKLKRNEYVHHKNERKTDNDDSNLELQTPLEHNRHHHGKYPVTKQCVVCGRTFSPIPSTRPRVRTCGRKCGSVLNGRIQARLADRDVRRIRALRRRGVRAAVVAKQYGVHIGHVYALCNGRRRHLTK